MADDSPRARARQALRELLAAIAELDAVPVLRVVDVEGKVAGMLTLWDARAAMPRAPDVVHQPAPADARDLCRADIMDVMRAAAGPLTRKEIIRALKEAGKRHGPGTVAKALADLTAAGDLVNPKDKKGYRLKGWRKDRTPSLFD